MEVPVCTKRGSFKKSLGEDVENSGISISCFARRIKNRR